MGIGFGIILLGLALMTGGGMPNPEVWDENIIYGFRRTVLAPFRYQRSDRCAVRRVTRPRWSTTIRY